MKTDTALKREAETRVPKLRVRLGSAFNSKSEFPKIDCGFAPVWKEGVQDGFRSKDQDEQHCEYDGEQQCGGHDSGEEQQTEHEEQTQPWAQRSLGCPLDRC